MNTIRLGIAGLGSMGNGHARKILAGAVPRMKLVAVADPVSDLSGFGPEVEGFTSSEEMIRSGKIDAVLIVTPHFSHTSLGIAALEQGLHVLVEKPISVHKADAERLIAAHKNPKQVFAAMFNMRSLPPYQKLRSLIQSGELGEIQRINWIITTWFRSDAYYKSGGWRATWEGEGGGVLLNQCPHNLDLLQWLFGMPTRLRAHCRLGRYHNIEVEDEVTAYLEYANGATGVFITSTGEAPGTNRLEISADRGRIILENNTIQWARTEVPVGEYCRTTENRFGGPGVWNVEIPVANDDHNQHVNIIRNFAEAILDGVPVIAPGADGLQSVELANAMLMSQFLDQAIEMPLDGAAYERMLEKKICESRAKKGTANA